MPPYVRACHRSLLVRLSAPADIQRSKLTASPCTNMRGREYPYHAQSKPVRCELIISRSLLSSSWFQHLAQGISSQTQVTIWVLCPDSLCRTTSRTTQSAMFIQSGLGIFSACRRHSCLSSRSLYSCSHVSLPCHTLPQPSESSSENSVLRLAIP